jgi:DNA-binding NarL/FixJ family response regulator
VNDHHGPDTLEQPIRVLIVDDAPRSRDGLRALLATLRYSSLAQPGQARQAARLNLPTALTPSAHPRTVEVVGEAADGQQAVRMVEEYRPDVILMDARMPGMDGLEATRIIKDRWPEVKVVILTMYPIYRAAALAAGADAILIKGCSPESLLEAILGQ